MYECQCITQQNTKPTVIRVRERYCKHASQAKHCFEFEQYIYRFSDTSWLLNVGGFSLFDSFSVIFHIFDCSSNVHLDNMSIYFGTFIWYIQL